MTPTQVILVGLSCLHVRMRECHPGCGHWSCPDCDLSWDDGGEGDLGFWDLRGLRARSRRRRRRAERSAHVRYSVGATVSGGSTTERSETCPST